MSAVRSKVTERGESLRSEPDEQGDEPVQLPPELWLVVMDKLSTNRKPASLLRLMLTCKSFYELGESLIYKRVERLSEEQLAAILGDEVEAYKFAGTRLLGLSVSYNNEEEVLDALNEANASLRGLSLRCKHRVSCVTPYFFDTIFGGFRLGTAPNLSYLHVGLDSIQLRTLPVKDLPPSLREFHLTVSVRLLGHNASVEDLAAFYGDLDALPAVSSNRLELHFHGRALAPGFNISRFGNLCRRLRTVEVGQGAIGQGASQSLYLLPADTKIETIVTDDTAILFNSRVMDHFPCLRELHVYFNNVGPFIQLEIVRVSAWRICQQVRPLEKLIILDPNWGTTPEPADREEVLKWRSFLNVEQLVIAFSERGMWRVGAGKVNRLNQDLDQFRKMPGFKFVGYDRVAEMGSWWP